MSTIAVYNGVTFTNVLTRSFRQEPVYDELSKTDLLYTKFTIGLEGIVHAHLGAPQIIFATAAANAIQMQRDVRNRLMVNRKGFTMQVGGVTLIACGPGTAQADMDNGPKPVSFEVLSIVGSESFKCLFTIELAVLECDAVSQAGGRVLSNRWSMEDEIDENWFVSRRITGQLRVSSVSVSPQTFRNLVIPALAQGFKMQSMRFASTPDGLTLNYAIEHRSQHAAPPAPGLTWECRHTETIGSEDNPQVCWSELQMKLTGQPGEDKQKLLQACMLVVQQKLKTLQVANGGFFPSIAVVDQVDQPVVEVLVRKRSVADDVAGGIENFFATIAGNWGKPLTLPGYNEAINPAPPPDGLVTTTVVDQFAAYLQTPCSDEHAFPQAANYLTGKPPKYDPTGPKPVIETMASPITQADDNYSSAHRANLYSHYRVSSRYKISHRNVQLPIAARTGTISPGDPTCDVIPLAVETAVRIVTIEGERLGAWPEVLAPTSYDDPAGGWATLLEHWVDPKPPQPTADQRTQLYSIDAQYEYALSFAPAENAPLRAGNLPWAKNGSLSTMGTSAYVSPTDSTRTPA